MENTKQILNRKFYASYKRGYSIILTIAICIFCLNNLIAQECKAKKTECKKSTSEVLTKVANDGNLEKLQTMIEKYDVDVNSVLENKESALTLASYHGHTDMVRYLLDKGAKLDTKNKWNNTALSNASMRGHNEIVDILLKNGADVNEKCMEGKTSLQIAIQNNHAKTVGILLENGADISIVNNYEQPAILMASWYGNPHVIADLASHGADVNFKSKSGNTVLHNLASNGNAKSIYIALKSGANANVLDENGRLPLHNAAINGKSEAVKALLTKTDNINIQENTLGNTPLHIASINGDIATVQALIEANAGANITNSYGKKPIDYAIKYGYTDVVTSFANAKLATKKDIQSVKQSLQAANTELVNGQAKVIYTGHSGWVVQTQENILVFDYWDKNLSSNKCLANGSLCGKEMKNKNIYVFVSHDHTDHFDTTIYSWADQADNITYIFGFKPEESWIYNNRTYTGPDYSYIDNNKTQKVKDAKVTTIKSNDTGQGFLVEIDGLTIFHPGDHALFTAEDRPVFAKEVDFIADVTNDVDIAFLPVSGCPSRWKKEYIVEGFFYTIDKLNPQQVYPMHALNREYTLKEFAELAEERKAEANIVCTENRGDSFMYTKSLTASK